IALSIFAHDHINFKKRFKFAKNIAKNLKKDGVYIMGGEILPKFTNENERKKALYLYHNFIIDKAKREGHNQLAVLEKEALISGLNKIGDFKRHVKMFEDEMESAYLKIRFKKKMGPKNNRLGGVYVYTFQK
ncbi:hypothetical protein KY326_03400, partial [Candidatus Woesearchaeota archaeon]|nr:hypothetical protein [Candidatus Woesearchaeota archaeon]